MGFELLSTIRNPQTIARGSSLRMRRRLQAAYGRGRWRKRKGFAIVRLSTGEIRDAELHWYEATGIGRREFKIKRFVD